MPSLTLPYTPLLVVGGKVKKDELYDLPQSIDDFFGQNLLEEEEDLATFLRSEDERSVFYDPLITTKVTQPDGTDGERYVYQGLYDDLSYLVNKTIGQPEESRIKIRDLKVVSRTFLKEIDSPEEDEYNRFVQQILTVAETSTDFSAMPDPNRRQFAQAWADDLYGMSEVVKQFIPKKGQVGRKKVQNAIGNYMGIHWRQVMAPAIKKSAREWGVGWEEGESGEYIQRGFKGLEITSHSFLEAFGYEVGLPKIEAYGRKMKEQAQREMAKIKPATGSFAEYAFSGGGRELDFEYALMKFAENAPQQLLTTGLTVSSLLAARYFKLGSGGGPLVKILTTAAVAAPGLSINFALESGSMFNESAEHLRSLRSQAIIIKKKGLLTDEQFKSRFGVWLSSDVMVTADKLTEEHVKSLASEMAWAYGAFSTAIEGVTDVALVSASRPLAKMMKSVTGVKTFGSRINNKYIRTFMKTGGRLFLTQAPIESIQEFIQEGGGEYLKSLKLPGYDYDNRVSIDAAYSGYIFGGVFSGGRMSSQAIHERLQKRREKNKVSSDIEEAESAVATQESDKMRSDYLKVGMALTSDYDKFLEDVGTEYKPEVTSLAGTYTSWYTYEGLKSALKSGGPDMIETFGIQRSHLERMDIGFTDKDIAEILGVDYIPRKGELEETDEFSLDAGHDPIFPDTEVKEFPNANVEAIVSQLEELQHEMQLTKVDKRKGWEGRLAAMDSKYRKLYKRYQGLSQKTTDEASDDSRAHEKQILIDRANEIVSWTDDEKAIVNKIIRKNASQKTIDVAKSLISKKEKAQEKDVVKKKEKDFWEIGETIKYKDVQDKVHIGKIQNTNDMTLTVETEDGKTRYVPYVNVTERRVKRKEETPAPVVKELTLEEIDADLKPKQTVAEITARMKKNPKYADWTDKKSEQTLAYEVQEYERFKKDPIAYLEDKVATAEANLKEGIYDDPAFTEKSIAKNKALIAKLKGEQQAPVVEVTPKDVHDAATDAGIDDVSTKEFMDMSEDVTGERHIDKMSSDQRGQLIDAIKQGEAPAWVGKAEVPAVAKAPEQYLSQDEIKRAEDMSSSMSESEIVDRINSLGAAISIPEEAGGDVALRQKFEKQLTEERKEILIHELALHKKVQMEGYGNILELLSVSMIAQDALGRIEKPNIDISKLSSKELDRILEDLKDLLPQHERLAREAEATDVVFARLSGVESFKRDIARIESFKAAKPPEFVGEKVKPPVSQLQLFNNTVLNIVKKTNDAMKRDVAYMPDHLLKMTPEKLYEIAVMKKVPGLDRFESSEGVVNPKRKEKLIQAIIDEQGPLEMSASMGGIPILRVKTKDQLFRWFSSAWRSTQREHGFTDGEFQHWTDQISRRLPQRIRPYFDEWAASQPGEMSAIEKYLMGVVNAFKPERNIKDLPSIYTEEEKEQMAKVFSFDSDYILQNIGWDEGERGGDVSFKEGNRRINMVAFKAMNIHIDKSEMDRLIILVKNSDSFEDWVTKISKQIPLKDGSTIYEAIRDSDEARRLLKSMYVAYLPYNNIKTHRGKQDGPGFRTSMQLIHFPNAENQDKEFGTLTLINKDTRDKPHAQWGRTMLGERHLGDVEISWISGNDLVSSNKNIVAPKDLKMRYQFFNRDELLFLLRTRFYEGVNYLDRDGKRKNMKLAPLFVRGEKDLMALVTVKPAHIEKARNAVEYWKGESAPQLIDGVAYDGVPQKMVDEYMGSYLKEGEMAYLYGSPLEFQAMNIARHEGMKQIMGVEYHKINPPTIMKRIRTLFTPAISFVGGPVSTVKVFDPENVTFVTTFEDGRKSYNQKASIMLDNKMQYILDGQTITSEKKFMYTYVDMFGTDPRSKRQKTMIGAWDESGTFIGKHQEMTAYVPMGGVMSVMDGDSKIAEIRYDGDGTNIYLPDESGAFNRYVDHLMTPDEVKVLSGKWSKSDEVELPSEATGLIRRTGHPKNYANFPMQLMNYITEPIIKKAVSDYIKTYSSVRSPTNLIRKVFTISKSGKDMDTFIKQIHNSFQDALPQTVVEHAKLGAGNHPNQLDFARMVVVSKLLEKSFSVLQDGSVLDFRGDLMGMVAEDETMVPYNVPSIKIQIWDAYKKAHPEVELSEIEGYNISKLNKWLIGGDVHIMLSRFPIPHGGGALILRVKGLLPSLAGDSFIVHPKVAKESLEADYDGDEAHIAFLPNNLIRVFKDHQKKIKGINLDKYKEEGQDEAYSFSRIEDMFTLFDELSFGQRAIGEIVNVQMIAGVVQDHFNHMVLDGDKIIVNKLSTTVTDENSGITGTLENIYRIYAQASFDNAEYRLLKKWNYSQGNLLRLLFVRSDGSPITDEQYNSIAAYIRILKTNGRLAHMTDESGNTMSLHDAFRTSVSYKNFTESREEATKRFILKKKMKNKKIDYASVGEVSMKSGEDSLHPHEVLTTMLDSVLASQGTLIDDLMKVTTAKSQIVHKHAVIKMEQHREEDMSRALGGSLKDLTEEAKKNAVKDVDIGNTWAQDMATAFYKELTVYSKLDVTDESTQFAQIWDYNTDFDIFLRDWYYGNPDKKIKGFSELSDASRVIATYKFLSPLQIQNREGNWGRAANRRQFPPVSREIETLLDPTVIERYNNYYNELLENNYNVKNKELKAPKAYKSIRIGREDLEGWFDCG